MSSYNNHNIDSRPLDESQQDEEKMRNDTVVAAFGGAVKQKLYTGVHGEYPMETSSSAVEVEQCQSTVSSMKLGDPSLDGKDLRDLLQSMSTGINDWELVQQPHRQILSTRNPRTALKEYYDEYLVVLSKKQFVTVTDFSEGHHIPQFTAFHVSPKTGDIFPSGQMDDANPDPKSGLWWYKKKDKAEFAAAGMALDFFHFQSHETATETFCNDFPPIALTLDDLASREVPDKDRSKIAKLQQEIAPRTVKEES